MIILDEPTFYLTLTLVACLCLMVGLLPLLITKAVSVPYLKAWLGKDRYAVLNISKTNAMTIEPATFNNGRVQLPHRIGTFIKAGYNGSYSLGGIRCDIALSHVDHIAEIDQAGAMAALNDLGIESLRDLTKILNTKVADDTKVPVKPETKQYASSILDSHPEYNMNIFYPLFGRLELKKLVDWAEATPELVAAGIAEGRAIAAANYSDAVVKKSGLDMKEMLPWIVLAFAGVMIALIVIKGMGAV